MDEQPEPVVLGIKSVMMDWDEKAGELSGQGVVTFDDGYTVAFITAYNPTEEQIRSAIKRVRFVAANAVRDSAKSGVQFLVMEW